MSPKKIAVVAAASVSVALFSIAGAQAATNHVRHHHHHATEVAAAGPAVAGGFYQPSEWGDFECSATYPGCRPYAAKDWSKP